MFIQTEQTPNPETLKFIPGRDVMTAGTAYFPTPDAAQKSPLAERIFAIDNVTAVFFGADFVTVSKSALADWIVLKPMILGAIMEHFMAGDPVIRAAAPPPPPIAAADDDAVVQQIRELIDTRVRPAVAQDGGDIVFHGFEEGIVYLYMQGSCAGCPSATITLKMGIENMLRHYIPEVVEVRALESDPY